jgi:thioesterase domain-containing protein/acyl carrier protein
VCDTDYIAFEPGDRVAFASSPAFDVTTFDVWGPLLNGGCTVIIPAEILIDPARLEVFLRERRITTLDLNTAVFNAIVRQRPAAFAPLRDLCFGGEAVEPRWVRAVLEAGPPERLVHNYGPTETTVLASWELVEHVDADATTVPIGRPIAHTTLHLLDEQGRPVPAGVPGEIHVGGSRIALGYLGRPELDAVRFVPDPFSPGDPDARLYRSGDLAVARLDGGLEFVGRIDTQVKVRGYRVELGEIETALARHPQVDLVVVHAWRRDDDTVLVAYVVAPDGAAPTLDDLRDHLRELVPPYMVPARLVRLDRLPLTPNDKVDRAALPEPDWAVAPSTVALDGHRRTAAADPADPADDVAVDDASERAGDGRGAADRETTGVGVRDVAREAVGSADQVRMAELWAGVLDLHRVDADADFFELGGHSLLAVALLAAVAEEFGVELTMADLVDRPTPQQMVAVVRARDEGWEAVRDGALELAPGRSDTRSDTRPDARLDGSDAPLVLIPPIYGLQPLVDARSLVRHLDPDRRVLLIELQGRTGRDRPLDTMAGLVQFYVERLRQVVPTGPVVLAGHSLGGAIALEMARQLDDPRVQAVVMFDTRVADEEWARWITTAKRPLRRARIAARERRGLPIDVGAEVKAATRRAWTTYRPRPWSGPVIYLAARGTDEKPELLRRDESWHSVLSGMELIETPGGHSGVGSLLDEPHVAATAARLTEALARRAAPPVAPPVPPVPPVLSASSPRTRSGAGSGSGVGSGVGPGPETLRSP